MFIFTNKLYFELCIFTIRKGDFVYKNWAKADFCPKIYLIK